MYRGNKIAVVVPAYNEEELIQETMSGIPDYVDRIYVINDGSTDRTEEIIRNFASTDSRFVLISHCTNKGVGAAITSGYKRAIE
ncbi:MAG TPA: glycosyltransferase family 2 protein, partial [Methanomassiliicoccaceae archaeon]|nr:glycosyltransferase family 2 protein [Methanomassiliicoccaceae archaeon]